MLRFEFLLALAMFFGHGAFWTYLFNVLHARPVSCRVKRFFERLLAAIAAAPLVALPFWADAFAGLSGYLAFDVYKVFCWFVGVFTLVSWTRRQWHSDVANGLRSLDSTKVTVRQPGDPTLLGHGWQVFANTPLNESEWFVVERKSIDVEIPEPWRGLRIAHLTDLHFTGRIQKPFYDAVIEQTLQLESDLIVITGDIIEHADCDEWLDSTLGQLEAPLGVYFILGNHDLQMPSVRRVRERLEGFQLIDAGGKIIRMETERGLLTIAGNELPWLGEAPEFSEPPLEGELRIGLIHTPDVFRWATESRCQLALGGHTHGGQIRLPLIGPMICPSVYGNRYAQGLFRRDETVMHISRGIGAMHPVRYACPPELALLTLD